MVVLIAPAPESIATASILDCIVDIRANWIGPFRENGIGNTRTYARCGCVTTER
jgi:hypothetical protein